MPTGYTSIIEDGDGATFDQYVWRCARAFGALVTMRDEKIDAEIPVKLEPSPYHAERVAEARAQIARLEAMTPEEADRSSAADYDARAKEWRRLWDRAGTLRERYATMRASVEDWTPPTSEHVGLKKFMLEQIDLCAKDGFGPYGEIPTRQRGEAWRVQQLTRARRDLEYAEKSLREEEARVAKRNEWISALRSSIAPPGRGDGGGT